MEPNDMGGMTIKDLREAKGNRTIAYVQVASEEEAVAASAAGGPRHTFPVWSALGQTLGFNQSAARCDGGYDGRRAIGLLWA